LDSITNCLFYFLSNEHAHLFIKAKRLQQPCDLAKGHIDLKKNHVSSVLIQGPAASADATEVKCSLC
jgi:hypothetical protein